MNAFGESEGAEQPLGNLPTAARKGNPAHEADLERHVRASDLHRLERRGQGWLHARAQGRGRLGQARSLHSGGYTTVAYIAPQPPSEYISYREPLQVEKAWPFLAPGMDVFQAAQRQAAPGRGLPFLWSSHRQWTTKQELGAPYSAILPLGNVISEGQASDNRQLFKRSDPIRQCHAQMNENGGQTFDQTGFEMGIARFFYAAVIPFALVEAPEFRSMFTHFPVDVRLPPAKSLGGKLLVVVKEACALNVIETIRNHGCVSLVTDVWTDVNSSSIMTFVVAAPTMPSLYWSSIPASTTDSIEREIGRVINEVQEVTGASLAVVVAAIQLMLRTMDRYQIGQYSVEVVQHM